MGMHPCDVAAMQGRGNLGRRVRVAVMVLACLPGCMTIVQRQEHPDTHPRVYSGTLRDLMMIGLPLALTRAEHPDPAALPILWPAAAMIGLGDLPLSLLADTFLLPTTIPEQTALNHKRSFIISAGTGRMGPAKKLLREHPELAQETYFDAPLLCIAAATGRAEFVALLLEKGVDVNAATGTGETPLYCAIDPSSVKLPGDLEKRNLPEAAYTDVVRLLMKNGAYPYDNRDRRYYNMFDKLADGSSPLGKAAESGKLELLRIMIDSGAIPTAQQRWSGQTPLHRAARAGHPEVVRFLVEHGAEVNIRNRNGKTPLGTSLGYGRHVPEKSPRKALFKQVQDVLRAHGGKQ